MPQQTFLAIAFVKVYYQISLFTVRIHCKAV